MTSGSDNPKLNAKKALSVNWLDIRRSHHFPFFVVCVLVALAFIGNTMFMLTLQKLGSWPTPVVTIAYGVFVGQICLLSIWCAIGNQQSIVRVPLSLGILIGLLCAYIMTFQYVMRLQSSVIAYAEIMIFTIALAMALLIQVPIWIFRFATHKAIADSNAQFVASQFTIRHLLSVTVVIALAIVAVQSVYGRDQILSAFAKLFLWTEFFPFATPIVAGAGIVSWLSVAIVFSEARRNLAVTIMSLISLFGPVIFVVFGRNYSKTVAANAAGSILSSYLFVLALFATVAGTLYLFYRIGYRLRRD